MKFGKLIDDIREKFSEINISFQDVPFGDRMTELNVLIEL